MSATRRPSRRTGSRLSSRLSSRPRRRGVALVGMAAALVLLTVAAPGAQAAGAAPEPPLTGENLGPDRLPRCAAVVASLTPRERVAQRLMVGVDAADPAATIATVRTTQVGGVFIGGNATELLRDQELRAVQAVARIPIAVAVDDEGGRVQRIDELDGPLPSARSMAAKMTPEQVRSTAAE